MLTTQQLAEHLNSISYKDGWNFHVYDGAFEGQHLVITAKLPDAFKPGESIALDIHSMLPPMPSYEYFERWLLWRLARIEVHECREFLRRNGKVIFNPHADAADRDLEPSNETQLPTYNALHKVYEAAQEYAVMRRAHMDGEIDEARLDDAEADLVAAVIRTEQKLAAITA